MDASQTPHNRRMRRGREREGPLGLRQRDVDVQGLVLAMIQCQGRIRQLRLSGGVGNRNGEIIIPNCFILEFVPLAEMILAQPD